MTVLKKDIQVIVEQLGEKLESLVIDYEQMEHLSKWEKKDMLKSDFHHVTMNFKSRLIELTKEL